MENIILQEIYKLSSELSSLSSKVNSLSSKVNSLSSEMNKRFERVESDLSVVKKSTLNMEIDYGKKLQMLLDIYPDIFSDNIEIKKGLEEHDKTLEDHSMIIEILKEKVLNQT